MPDTTPPLAGADAEYRDLRVARFVLLGAVAAQATRLAPIARPPWRGVAGSVGVEAYRALDHLDGIADACARNTGIRPGEFGELLEGALPLLDTGTIAAAYTFLAALKATA